jgi:DNA-binding Lrp family transcriptional regulator
MSDEEILDIVRADQPVELSHVERAADASSAEVRARLREMLYAGTLETTPDWKYEVGDQ